MSQQYLISNLYLVNSNFLTFKIISPGEKFMFSNTDTYSDFSPPIKDRIDYVSKIPNFYISKNSTKLIVVILRGEKEDDEVIIVSGTEKKSKFYGSTYFNEYKVVFSSLTELEIENGEAFQRDYYEEETSIDNIDCIKNYYSIIKIFITEIPKHNLYELEIRKFNQLVDLYEEYKDKIIDEKFLVSLIHNPEDCCVYKNLTETILRKENNDIILLTNKHFYPEYIKHYDSTKYNKVKVYCVINERTGRHYSLNDSESYQDKFTKWNTGIILQMFDKNKIDDLMKQVMSDKNNGFICFVIFSADPFNNICNLGENAPNILINKLIRLYTLCTVIPDIDMLISIGSKSYVADKEFNDLMLPNTLTYPGNEEKIKNLPLDHYIMKQGYSGSASEFYSWQYDSKTNKQSFYRSFRTVLKLSELKPATGEEIYIALKEKYETRKRIIEERRSSKFFDESDTVPCNNFFIIQKYSELFKNCHEFKFSVVQVPVIDINKNVLKDSFGRIIFKDEIICIHTSNIRIISNFNKYLSEHGELPPINQHIINFINNVVNIVKRKWRNYVYLRVDIICECDSENKYDVLFSQNSEKDLFSPKIYPTEKDVFSPKIYLNEIEHLGSGLKNDCTTIDDKQINLHMYETNKYDQIYDNLVDNFMSIIDSKL